MNWLSIIRNYNTFLIDYITDPSEGTSAVSSVFNNCIPSELLELLSPIINIINDYKERLTFFTLKSIYRIELIIKSKVSFKLMNYICVRMDICKSK